ncbi:MAG: hypothetical protein IPN22_11280 [Bacteroidetes bacterium]|nr:hypothetical protein [Bacteroidota bacterium]
MYQQSSGAEGLKFVLSDLFFTFFNVFYIETRMEENSKSLKGAHAFLLLRFVPICQHVKGVIYKTQRVAFKEESNSTCWVVNFGQVNKVIVFSFTTTSLLLIAWGNLYSVTVWWICVLAMFFLGNIFVYQSILTGAIILSAIDYILSWKLGLLFMRGCMFP